MATKNIHIHIGGGSKTRDGDESRDVANVFKTAASIARDVASKCDQAARDASEWNLNEAQSIRIDLGLIKGRL